MAVLGKIKWPASLTSLACADIYMPFITWQNLMSYVFSQLPQLKIGTAVMGSWGWWEAVMMYRQEQGKAELRSASTMSGGLSVILSLEAEMLGWSANNWRDSRERVSLVSYNCLCWHIKWGSDQLLWKTDNETADYCANSCTFAVAEYWCEWPA